MKDIEIMVPTPAQTPAPSQTTPARPAGKACCCAARAAASAKADDARSSALDNQIGANASA